MEAAVRLVEGQGGVVAGEWCHRVQSMYVFGVVYADHCYSHSTGHHLC